MMPDPHNNTIRSSSISGFFKKSKNQRLEILASFAGLTDDDLQVLRGDDTHPAGGLSFDRADRMVENAIGVFSLPLGIATHFRINGRDHLIPMVVEEPSVVAAASKGAKTARIRGGFDASADESYSIGQIQVLDVPDVQLAITRVSNSAEEIIQIANQQSGTLSKMGRGAKEVTCRIVGGGADVTTDDRHAKDAMLVVELLIDVGDAMGANITNTMCEAIAPLVENVTGGRALLRILSNYSTRRLARASAVFDRDVVGGEKVINDIIAAYRFADNDVYRAVTHNKGVMNGIIAVANATGQDSRAIEAAANAFAARLGRYRSLTQWGRDTDGNLVGTLEIPMSVGTVGGISSVHPLAAICTKKILGISSAQDLACVMVSAGLAQNYSALRALATEGIQRGHMRLHAKNLAAAAGATTPEQIDEVSQNMIAQKRISLDAAKEILRDL